MSTGHPNRRRSGASHARHGPQRQDRPERPSGQPNGALETKDTHVTSARRGDYPQQYEHNAQATPVIPAARQRAKRDRQTSTLGVARSASPIPTTPVVPVARRRSALRVMRVDTPPSAQPHVQGDASDGAADENPVLQTSQADVVVRSYEAHEVHEVRETHDVHEIREARDVRRMSHEEHSFISASTHLIIAHADDDVLRESDESDEINVIDEASPNSHNSHNSHNGHSHQSHTGAPGVNGSPEANNEAPAEKSGESAPRLRGSRFYAPGLRFRPDESWVERPPVNARPAPEPSPEPGRAPS